MAYMISPQNQAIKMEMTLSYSSVLYDRGRPYSIHTATIIFLVAALLLHIASIILSARNWHIRVHVAMLAIGLMSLVFWSGLIVGPILAFIAALFPSDTKA
jgi:hypothetical protein